MTGQLYQSNEFLGVCIKDTVLKIYFLYYNMETISNAAGLNTTIYMKK
jgi:hypothetical protein